MYSAPVIPTSHSARALSFLETFAAIAAAGILSWIVVASQSGATLGAAATKLESDVTTVNRSIQIYLANGGSLAGITDPQAVLDKLKTVPSAEERAKYVGFSGPMIDLRLAVRATTPEEVRSPKSRAVWNPRHLRFDITASGAGIAEFILDEARGHRDYGSEARQPAERALAYEPSNNPNDPTM